MSVFLVIPTSKSMKSICVDLNETQTLADLKLRICSSYTVEDDAYFVTHCGGIPRDTDFLQNDGIYYLCPRVLGGKGGFGSMLRAIGAQIEKTTNREACRDLSGRRMRDVNNEKKLKDWISKKADREREKERIRKERLARRLAVPKHNFDDPDYEDQKTKVADNLEGALQAGLQKCVADGESSKTTGDKETLGKRTADITGEPGPSKAKASRKSLEWMGIEGSSDLDSDISDSDSDEDVATAPSTSSAFNLSSVSTDPNNDGNGTKRQSQSSAAETAEKSDEHNSSLLSMLPPPSSVAQAHPPSQIACNTDPASVNLDDFSTAEEVQQLGLDTLKAVLMFRGLKCGGTLQQRADRLFSVKGLMPEEIDSSLLAKPQNGKGGKKKKS